MSKEGGEMVWLILDFQDSFFFFCPPQAHVWLDYAQLVCFFSPPQNSNVAGSAKWAQIRKMPNYSIIRRTNWIFSFATTTWYICLLAYTVKNVSVIVKHYGTTYPNSPLSVHSFIFVHFYLKVKTSDVKVGYLQEKYQSEGITEVAWQWNLLAN